MVVIEASFFIKILPRIPQVDLDPVVGASAGGHGTVTKSVPLPSPDDLLAGVGRQPGRAHGVAVQVVDSGAPVAGAVGLDPGDGAGIAPDVIPVSLQTVTAHVEQVTIGTVGEMCDALAGDLLPAQSPIVVAVAGDPATVALHPNQAEGVKLGRPER